jgi:hypothetical protein
MTYTDPFVTEQTGKTGSVFTIDKLPGLWQGTPLWGRISLAALPLLLILLVFILVFKRKNKRRQTVRKKD